MSVTARVIGHGRHFYTVLSEKGEQAAKLSGSLRYNAALKSDLPAIGDWVEISLRGDKAYIVSVHKRKSCFSRKESGNVIDEQVLAANLDILFIVMSLDENFNINRLQRFISAARTGNILPVIVLSKSDVCKNVEELSNKVKCVFPDIAIFTTSSKIPATYDFLKNYLLPGVTAAFTGSSGVGKSTIINLLLGEHRQKTADISKAVNKGRHTTSSRDMIFLSNGAVVIDTPGIREFQLWENETPSGFQLIDDISLNCRFSDCKHETEPDCAVKDAILEGKITAELVEMWKKHKIEIDELKKKKEEALKIINNRKTKARKSN